MGLDRGATILPEDGGFAGAIDGGGFHETLGDAREEGAGKDHVEDADGAGENHGPAGVVEAQVFDEKKVGDHTAAEEGGEDDHHGDEVASPETFAGQGVGGHTGEDDVDEGADDSVVEGVAVGDPDGGVGEDLFVGLEIEALGKEPDLLPQDAAHVAEEHAEDVEEGIESDDWPQ